jgi:D-alanyl-D-alanine carboxypeptidase
MPSITRRNFLSLGSASALALAASRVTVTDLHAAPKTFKSKKSPDTALDAFIASYMRAMNAPGMTLGTANKFGTVRVATYGFDDIDVKQRLEPTHLFHIGSITKSFVALVLLQLREEGKVELHKPVLEYLPWLPIENTFGAITAHHLLTHTSGLPDAIGLFPSDRSMKWQQAYKPGERFYYSNLGFAILGNLIESLDGRTWPAAVKARVIDRIGMTSASANITNELRARTAKSYVPFDEDRPYPRMGKLAPAGNIQFDDAAGSIASNAHDMTLYIQMLINRGEAGSGRIISDDSFALMAKAYVKAEEFGPTASYGYGIAIDSFEGHTVLRHTGGMPSFASALLVDPEGGFGSFASINAMQGYRPTPVVQYAVQLMNAGSSRQSLPSPPGIDDPTVIPNAGDYLGTYITTDGKKLDIVGDKQLFATINGRKMVLQRAEGDSFLTEDPEFGRYVFTFGRAKPPATETQEESGAEHKTKTQPVIELTHGPDWFRNDKYTGPIDFRVPEYYKAFTGYYLGSGAFPANAEILIRKGELCMEGAFRLVPIGENEFVPENGIPERLEFLYVAGGKARLMKFGGSDLWRFERS